MSKLEKYLEDYFESGRRVLDYFNCNLDFCYYIITGIENSYWRLSGDTVQSDNEIFSNDEFTYLETIVNKNIYSREDYTLFVFEDIFGGSPYIRIFPNSKRII